jgi:hypothetical protein
MKSTVKVLHLIRSEADFERITSLALSAKNIGSQHFVFYGDTGVIFNDDIRNTFQKHIISINGFHVIDAIDFLLLGKLYKLFRRYKPNAKSVRILLELVLKVLFKLIYRSQASISKSIIRKLNPDILITDNSEERENYFPHYLREEARKKDVVIYITGHGPAGVLHKEYSSFEDLIQPEYSDCTMGICSKHDYGFDLPNRIITGDPADSYPNLMYKHSLTHGDVSFLDDRKYKIGFFMAAPFETCTNGWSVMEEIMLDYAGDKDVAMIVKFHPRLYKFGDYRYLTRIDNLRMFGSELDRSKLVKWADIVICSDHCSTIFEPMIMQKKVVAIHSKKTRQFADKISPIHKSDPTMNSIHSSTEFKLDGLSRYTSDKKFIDEYCWGGHGTQDLGEGIFKELMAKL